MSKEDIEDAEFNIKPDAPRPGVPIKKSTLLVMGLVVLGGAALSAIFIDATAPSPQATATATKKPGEATEPTGTSFSIQDEELKSAKLAVEEAERQGTSTPAPRTDQQPVAQAPAAPKTSGASAQTAPTSMPGGVMPNLPNFGAQSAQAGAANGAGQVRPNIPSVANGQNNAGINGGANAPLPAGARTGNASQGATGGGRDTEFETEAQARASRSMVFDDGAPSGSAIPQPSIAGFPPMPGMLPTAGGPDGMGYATRNLPQVTPVVGQPASAAAQQGLNSNMASLQAQLAAAQGRPNQGAPVSRDGAWLNEYSNAPANKTNEALKSYPTASRYTLHQGKTIPAVLGRELNSDLPGEVTAYTTTDVYDSLGGGSLLIPKGSVMVGRYSSDIKIGQSRVMFAFNRIILPNGQSFDLPGAQGQDVGGAAGAPGEVNNHFLRMFGASFFTAWLADRVTPTNQSMGYGGVTTTVSPAGQVLVDTSRTILDRSKTIQPTITVAKGSRINIEVKKDMEFAGPYDRRSN